MPKPGTDVKTGVKVKTGTDVNTGDKVKTDIIAKIYIGANTAAKVGNRATHLLF